MAATCLDVITSALRLGRVLSSGGVPKAAEAADGMACLQSLYDGWLATGMFGRLEDVYLVSDDVAQEGKRYLLAAGVTLTEPSVVSADDSADGAARQPRDLGLYESVASDGTRAVRLYDRTGWVDLIDLDQGAIAPLSGRGQMGLAAVLACSGPFIAMFNDSAAMNPDIRRVAYQFMAGLSYKLGSTRDRTTVDYS